MRTVLIICFFLRNFSENSVVNCTIWVNLGIANSGIDRISIVQFIKLEFLNPQIPKFIHCKGFVFKMRWYDYIEDKVKSMNIDHYEVYLAQAESTSIEVKDQQVECFTSSHSKGLSLRVLNDNRLGFSYSTEFTNASLDQVISNAVMSAKNSSTDEFYGFPEKSRPLPRLTLFDQNILSITKEEKIEKAKILEREAVTYDKRITKVRKAVYQERTATEHLINSNGVDLSHRRTLFSCSVEVVAEGKGDSQMGWDFDFSCFYHELDVAKVGRLASSKAIGLLGAQPAASFRGAVIFDNSVGSQFLGVLAPSFLAESVQKNKSILKEKTGKKIFSSKIDIVDDGLYPDGIATKPFDGEGVIRQSTSLVNQGILNNFLYDTYCAKKDKTHSTGNSSRGSIKSPPKVGFSNLYIKNGEETPDALVSYVNKGIFVNEVMGIHTANPISGDFSVGVTGFLIENGKKTTPLKGIAIAGNVMTLFNRIAAVGNDLRFYGHTGSPSLMIEEMDISGK